MNEKELLEKWELGKRWLTENGQVSKTNKNYKGKIYDHRLYLKGLIKLEAIEDELQRQGINYGQE